MRKEIATVNVAAINDKFEDGATVTIEALVESVLSKKTLDGVKVLGQGELTKKLTVQANAFSASAKAKIEAAGGKAESNLKMFKTFANAWKIPELRKKILFTL